MRRSAGVPDELACADCPCDAMASHTTMAETRSRFIGECLVWDRVSSWRRPRTPVLFESQQCEIPADSTAALSHRATGWRRRTQWSRSNESILPTPRLGGAWL